MVAFRILHISDLHFAIQPFRNHVLSLPSAKKHHLLAQLYEGGSFFWPSTYDIDMAEAVARFAFEQKDNYDLICATGDLATTGLDEDLGVAFEFFDSPSNFGWLNSRMKPTLAGSGKTIQLMPGNHDRYQDVKANAGNVKFDQLFSKYWKPSQHLVDYKIARKDGEQLALVSVDFSLAKNGDALFPSRITRYGQGRAYTKRVQELEDVTTSIRQSHPGIVVIWLMHFLPVAGGVVRKLRIIDSGLVAKAASRANIPIILSGHTHKSGIHPLTSTTQVFCAGSATSIDAKSGNSLHYIDLEVANGNLQSSRRQNFVFSNGNFS